MCKSVFLGGRSQLSIYLVIQKGKGKFLYSAVSGPQDSSKCFHTLLPWQTCSIKHCLNFSGKHPTICYNNIITCEDCSYTYPPLSIARYSFTQLSELEQCRVKKLAQGFNTAAQDSNPGSLSRESKALPLSHCALHKAYKI